MRKIRTAFHGEGLKVLFEYTQSEIHEKPVKKLKIRQEPPRKDRMHENTKKWPALCRRTGAPLAPRPSQPQHPPNEQKIKKYLGADQGSFWLKKGSSSFFNLFLFHVVAPLGLRNWEPEPGPESALFQLAGAKRTKNGFRRGAAVRPFDFVFGGANLHRIWGGCVARLTPNPEQKIYFLLGSTRFGRFSLRFWAVFCVLADLGMFAKTF